MPDSAASYLNPQSESDVALDMLLSRVSVSPALLGDPAPGDLDLNDILDAALRAPDHGRLTPWRFVLVRGDSRSNLGEVFVKALRGREPHANEKIVERERTRPLRAPLVIAVGTNLRPENAIPEIEQVLAVGAATMNMLNAAHALGYGAMWVTGKNSYDPLVAEALGFSAPDRLIGYLYVGTPTELIKPASRPNRDEFVSEWTGPAAA